MKSYFLFAMPLALLLCAGCISDIRLFTTGSDPLKEFTISGSGYAKVLLLPVNGAITLDSDLNLLHLRQGVVPEVVSQLNKAEQDSRIQSVVLLINSPGGTVTASDILFEEIMRFKQRTGKKVYAMMLDLAASGGYYAALAADRIYAHPTTLTGSVGAIFIHPEFG